MGVMPGGVSSLEFANTVCLTRLPPMSPTSEDPDDGRARTDPCNGSAPSWPESEDDAAAVEKRRLSLLPGSLANPCTGPPDCMCGCKDMVDAPPTAERPCLHNEWDDVRTRKSSKILRCRVCQRKWKLPSSNVPRCVGFLKGECDLGAKCDRLHVFKKKVAVEERVERFGPQILQAQTQQTPQVTTRRSSAPPAPLSQDCATAVGNIARRRSCVGPHLDTYSPTTEPNSGTGVSPVGVGVSPPGIGALTAWAFPGTGPSPSNTISTPEARGLTCSPSPASLCSAPTLQSGVSPNLDHPGPVCQPTGPGWSPGQGGRRRSGQGGLTPRSDTTAPVDALRLVVPRRSSGVEEDPLGSRQSTGPCQPIYSPTPPACAQAAFAAGSPTDAPTWGSPQGRRPSDARSAVTSRAGSDVCITVGDDGNEYLECANDSAVAMTESELDHHLSWLQATGRLPGPKRT